MNFYTFKNKEMPWGDYGRILFEGYAFYKAQLEDIYNSHILSKAQAYSDNDLLIERAGPFVPPVYLCSRCLLISEAIMEKLK